MKARAIQQLDESQLRNFDTEYVRPHMWEVVRGRISRAFPDQDFTLLDVGGGNGVFVDRVLDAYPRARVTVVDNAAGLLATNRPHERKELVKESAERTAELFRGRAFDIICFHWVLHHMVTGSYRRTREMQVHVLGLARSLLSPRGRLSVFENVYRGRVVSRKSGWLIYQLTSSKLLSAMTKRGGANTAGVGVAFLDRGEWLRTFARAGLEVEESSPFQPWRVKLARRVLLNIRSVHEEQFWLKATNR
jgi:hypothetical protein